MLNLQGIFAHSLGRWAGAVTLIIAITIGLEMVGLISYFAFNLAKDITVPFSQFSDARFVIEIAKVLGVPSIGLLGAIAGFYFASSRSSDPKLSDKAVEPHWLVGSLSRALRATLFLSTHLFIAALLIGLTQAMHYLLQLIFLDKEILLFDRVPITWIFDVMTAAIFLIFLIRGTWEAILAIRD